MSRGLKIGVYKIVMKVVIADVRIDRKDHSGLRLSSAEG